MGGEKVRLSWADGKSQGAFGFVQIPPVIARIENPRSAKREGPMRYRPKGQIDVALVSMDQRSVVAQRDA